MSRDAFDKWVEDSPKTFQLMGAGSFKKILEECGFRMVYINADMGFDRSYYGLFQKVEK